MQILVLFAGSRATTSPILAVATWQRTAVFSIQGSVFVFGENPAVAAGPMITV